MINAQICVVAGIRYETCREVLLTVREVAASEKNAAAALPSVNTGSGLRAASL